MNLPPFSACLYRYVTRLQVFANSILLFIRTIYIQHHATYLLEPQEIKWYNNGDWSLLVFVCVAKIAAKVHKDLSDHFLHNIFCNILFNSIHLQSKYLKCGENKINIISNWAPKQAQRKTEHSNRHLRTLKNSLHVLEGVKSRGMMTIPSIIYKKMCFLEHCLTRERKRG